MRVKRAQKPTKWSAQKLLSILMLFLFGFMLCATFILQSHISQSQTNTNANTEAAYVAPGSNLAMTNSNAHVKESANANANANVNQNTNKSKGLQGLRVLVAIASFDFSQFALLEEVLDSYQDVCVAGATVDLYIHTAVPYTGTYVAVIGIPLFTCLPLNISIPWSMAHLMNITMPVSNLFKLDSLTCSMQDYHATECELKLLCRLLQ